MANNDSTGSPNKTSQVGASTDVSLLRTQRADAERSGDTAKVAELDRQIGDAEQAGTDRP